MSKETPEVVIIAIARSDLSVLARSLALSEPLEHIISRSSLLLNGAVLLLAALLELSLGSGHLLSESLFFISKLALLAIKLTQFQVQPLLLRGNLGFLFQKLTSLFFQRILSISQQTVPLGQRALFLFAFLLAVIQ